MTTEAADNVPGLLRSITEVESMSLQFDPQILQELAPQLAAAADMKQPAVGDVATRRLDTRRMVDQLMASRGSAVEIDVGIDVERYSLTTGDGATLGLSWYRRAGSAAPGSAVLYIRGGGMILGLDEVGDLYDATVRGYVEASSVPMLVVDYRIAPEYAHPVPVEDCYAALEWLAAHASELGADPSRLAVMGDSCGGGLAAGVCLLARDRGGPAIAQQLLIYLMRRRSDGGTRPSVASVLDVALDMDLRRQRHQLGRAAGRQGR
ncbi:alpha/beta hydrolase [Rhodococcus marinonascens]|uniref:alpha/beta hydrolase n=1 Tax=Rhodococcus marinonascens TaxID=38311 RepID=UPI0027D78A46|nr:alpha/beta hydrolase fold domain-containing protein [Rhodococcus marinonascens]